MALDMTHPSMSRTGLVFVYSMSKVPEVIDRPRIRCLQVIRFLPMRSEAENLSATIDMNCGLKVCDYTRLSPFLLDQ